MNLFQQIIVNGDKPVASNTDKATELHNTLAEASQKYYTDGTSELSDAEFDSMLNELKELNPTDSVVTDVGHGYEVEKDTTPGEKVKHKYGIVGSLDKCHNFAELDNRLKNRQLYASLKLDGLSVVLYYDKGQLYQALTRGKDGVGIDITDKVKVILDDNEKSLRDTSFSGAVRGEILMSYDNFNAYKKLHDEAENARNTAAGLINTKEVNDDLKYLNILVYTVIGVTSETNNFTTYLDMAEWLHNNFNHYAKMTFLIDRLDETNIEAKMNELQSKWYGEYPADGIVLTINDTVISKVDAGYSIIYTAQAFKFPAEKVETTVTDVEWTLSKTGYLIPVVKVEPVRLAGTTVSAATGLHAQNISDNWIGPGAKVLIEKANEIIPKILEVTSPGAPILPTTCPSCGGELTWAGVHLQCQNSNCVGTQLQDVLILTNTIAPTLGLGDQLKVKFLTELLNNNITVENLYFDTSRRLNAFDLSQKVTFNTMLDDLFSKKIDLATAITALNIPRFGGVNSKKLAEYPEIVKNLMNDDSYVITDEQRNLIGDANTESIIANRSKFKRLKLFESQLIWESAQTKGKVVITGSLSVPRNIFEQELKNNGYELGSSITKATMCLITNDPLSNSSKNQAADKNGVPKYTEAEFRSKFLS